METMAIRLSFENEKSRVFDSLMFCRCLVLWGFYSYCNSDLFGALCGKCFMIISFGLKAPYSYGLSTIKFHIFM